MDEGSGTFNFALVTLHSSLVTLHSSRHRRVRQTGQRSPPAPRHLVAGQSPSFVRCLRPAGRFQVVAATRWKGRRNLTASPLLFIFRHGHLPFFRKKRAHSTRITSKPSAHPVDFNGVVNSDSIVKSHSPESDQIAAKGSILGALLIGSGAYRHMKNRSVRAPRDGVGVQPSVCPTDVSSSIPADRLDRRRNRLHNGLRRNDGGHAVSQPAKAERRPA